MRRAFAALVLVCGCSRACDAPSAMTADAGDASAPSSFSQLDSGSPLAPARCVREGEPNVVAEAGDVLGDVRVVGKLVYLAAVRKGRAVVGRTTDALGAPEWHDLGRTLADAPPPVLVSAPGDRVSALFWEVGDGGARSLVVTIVGEAVERPWTIPQVDASESMAVAAMTRDAVTLVAWDAPEGIRVASLERGQAASVRDVPRAAIVSGVRIAPRGATGAWLAWTERKSDATIDAGSKPTRGEFLEAPSERRSSEWIVVARVDASGALVGQPASVTSETGHHGRFDLATRANGSVALLAVEEVELGEAGGRLVRVPLDDNPSARVVPEPLAAAVGRGTPASTTDARGEPWVTFEDTLGHSRVVPLGGAAPAPSLEMALEEARLAAPLNEGRWLVASSAAPTLTRVRCSP